MCLTTSNPVTQLAEKPIQVWKRLIKTDNGFKTPYQYVAVKVNESLKALYPDAKVRGNPYFPEHIVDIQGVHAYITQDKAEINKCSNEVITEWEIPAGAKYWIGDECSLGEIAATEMKFIKVCKEKKIVFFDEKSGKHWTISTVLKD